MKRVLVLLVSILFFVSCKRTEHKKEEQLNVEIEKKIETIDDYLNLDKKKDAIEVNDIIGEHVRIENVSVFKDKTENKTYLVLKLSEKVNQDIKDNYRVIARTFPLYLDDLREDSEERNLKYDSWYSKINEISIGTDEYLTINLSDSEGKFKKIIFQLIENKTNKISKKKIYVRDLFVRKKESKN